jgi:hypothetical protein
MDIAAFVLGATVAFWSMAFPLTAKDIGKSIFAFGLVGIGLWLIRSGKGEALSILFTMALVATLFVFVLSYRKKLLPYLHEMHILLWNVLLLYTGYVTGLLALHPVAFLVPVIISFAFVLLPLHPSQGLRTILYAYLLVIMLLSYALPLYHADIPLLSFLKDKPVALPVLFMEGVRMCGLFATLTLCLRIDLYSKHDNAKMRTKRYREYELMAKRFSDAQFPALLLLGITLLLTLILVSNTIWPVVSPGILLTFMIIGYNLLANYFHPADTITA